MKKLFIQKLDNGFTMSITREEEVGELFRANPLRQEFHEVKERLVFEEFADLISRVQEELS